MSQILVGCFAHILIYEEGEVELFSNKMYKWLGPTILEIRIFELYWWQQKTWKFSLVD